MFYKNKNYILIIFCFRLINYVAFSDTFVMVM